MIKKTKTKKNILNKIITVLLVLIFLNGGALMVLSKIQTDNKKISTDQTVFKTEDAKDFLFNKIFQVQSNVIDDVYQDLYYFTNENVYFFESPNDAYPTLLGHMGSYELQGDTLEIVFQYDLYLNENELERKDTFSSKLTYSFEVNLIDGTIKLDNDTYYVIHEDANIFLEKNNMYQKYITVLSVGEILENVESAKDKLKTVLGNFYQLKGYDLSLKELTHTDDTYMFEIGCMIDSQALRYLEVSISKNGADIKMKRLKDDEPYQDYTLERMELYYNEMMDEYQSNKKER